MTIKSKLQGDEDALRALRSQCQDYEEVKHTGRRLAAENSQLQKQVMELQTSFLKATNQWDGDRAELHATKAELSRVRSELAKQVHETELLRRTTESSEAQAEHRVSVERALWERRARDMEAANDALLDQVDDRNTFPSSYNLLQFRIALYRISAVSAMSGASPQGAAGVLTAGGAGE